ncbi:aspartyl protease [Ectocarpus siliculosus]|uniref:Aspartyl protease n=1 Tax=Ectocarpus siliculosus TaxID=2880 RepID=D7FNI8_ECTSI|nr:aspartyl protease [Ectocarpus siliculosus]|eukprot:CBJ25999.1 aspartyl protease [Ectocarpus siliculosus]
MPSPFRTSAAPALVLLAAATRTSCASALHLRDGSVLEVDRELPGPNLDNGTPTKLYSLSLGRVRRDHMASADLASAMDAMRRGWHGHRSLLYTMSFEETPLFLGYGTHFAYIYAGTPPQRASVIINTGSHFSAFPCSECRSCGNHTDPYWDPSQSSTAHIVTCDETERCHGAYKCQSDKKCVLREHYTEGSSWRAKQVDDLLWVGERTLSDSQKHDDSAFSVDFTFGCIESLTGLFKTQLADGIMGLNADSRTLITQLATAGKISERKFSLCFSETGGTMVIGGYDPLLNKPGSEMQYTPSTGEISAPTVKVTDVTLNGVSITTDASVFQKGTGIKIVSGTTNTYLPRAVAEGFSAAWEAATGSPYATCKMNEFCMTRTTVELEALPVLMIHMDGGVEVNVRPEAYMDASSDEENVYPSLPPPCSMGGVLGANLLRDHNVVFDYDNHVVGFADGACDYHADSRGSDGGSAGAEGGPAVEAEANVDCVTAAKRVEECDAECPTGQSEPSTAEGREIWVDEVITHPQGSGQACPDKMAEEHRGCVKDCP